MSASLFEIKKPMVETPKKRKQRSDKGKTRKQNKVVEVPVLADKKIAEIGVDKHESLSNTKDMVPLQPERSGSWYEIYQKMSNPQVVIPLTAALGVTGYLIHQGYNYLLSSNDCISALSTSIAAEAVMMCAAAAHAFSKGISKVLLLGVMGAMIVSGAMYMHSSVAAGAKGSDAVYQRAVESRNGIAKSLEVARKSVEGIPETYASKRAVALQSVTELETKLAASDTSLAQLSPAPAGVTYNLLVRLCAMVLCLMLTHMAVRGIKQ